MLPGSSIGQRLVLTSFGESHGRSIGAVLDGCPAGLEIDEKEIQEMLDLRKPGQNIISTQRKEGDVVEIVSGVFRGFTTGAPITMLIWNADQKSKDYENLKTKLNNHDVSRYCPRITKIARLHELKLNKYMFTRLATLVF